MLPTFVIGLREGVRGVADRGDHRRVPAPGGPRGTRCGGCGLGVGVAVAAVHRDRGRPADPRRRAAAAAAGAARDRGRRRRRRDGHVHDRLDAPPRARARRRAARERRQRARARVDLGAGGDGVLCRSFARGSRRRCSCSPRSRHPGDATSAGAGATLGVLVAVVVGCGIYRGGVRLNLARFFRLTAVALVLVAAGLVMSALSTPRTRRAGSTACRIGRSISAGSFAPGTVLSSLLTGVLGLQPQPTVGESLAAGSSTRCRCSRIVLWPDRCALAAAAHPSRAAKRRAIACLLVLPRRASRRVAAAGGGGAEGCVWRRRCQVTLSDAAARRRSSRPWPRRRSRSRSRTAARAKVTELELKNDSGIILGERENIVARHQRIVHAQPEAGTLRPQLPQRRRRGQRRRSS